MVNNSLTNGGGLTLFRRALSHRANIPIVLGGINRGDVYSLIASLVEVTVTSLFADSGFARILSSLSYVAGRTTFTLTRGLTPAGTTYSIPLYDSGISSRSITNILLTLSSRDRISDPRGVLVLHAFRNYWSLCFFFYYCYY